MALSLLPAPAARDAAAFNARIRRLGDSARYRRLERWEKIWHGSRYDDRPSFWAKDVPLQERAPYIVVPIVRSAGKRLVAMVLGEGRFPSIGIKRNAAKRAGLTTDDCAKLEAFISEVLDTARARQQFRLGASHALACGTNVMLVSIRDGQPCIDVIPAKWCTPKRDARTGDVCELEILYRFDVDTLDPISGTENVSHFWFRRLITHESDTTFMPEPVDENGYMPSAWTPDPTKTFRIPFCSVTWHRSMPSVDLQGDIDGTALAEGLVDETEALDFTASLGHRNARYNAEPQMVTIGAPDIDGPTGRANSAKPSDDNLQRAGFTTVNPSIPGEAQPWWKRAAQWVGGKILRKAPGTVWKLPPNSDAKMLESSGSGADILERDYNRIRAIILDALAVVMSDPEKIGTGDISARALALMHAPMIAEADSLFEEWIRDMIAPVVTHLLRLIASQQTIDAGGVGIPGWEDVVPLLLRFYDPAHDRFRLPLEFKQGPYFDPSASDVQSSIASARTAAGDRPVLSLRTAIGLIPGVRDVDAELAALEGAAGEDAAAMKALLAGDSAHADDAAPVPGADASTDANVQQTALNGAQVSSLIEIIAQVSTGSLPRDAAVNAMALAFQITPAEADRILASAGRGFVPSASGSVGPPTPPTA